MASLFCVLGLLFLFLDDALASYCKSYDYYYTRYIYCPNGCCGTSYNKYCCIYINYPLYIGLGIGGFLLLLFIIALICAFVKSGTKSGRVIGAQPSHGVMTVSSTVRRFPTGYSGTVPQPPPYSANPQAGYPPPYPSTGYHPPPTGFNPPPTDYHPPPAPVQGNPPPPPTYSEPSAPQSFT